MHHHFCGVLWHGLHMTYFFFLRSQVIERRPRWRDGPPKPPKSILNVFPFGYLFFKAWRIPGAATPRMTPSGSMVLAWYAQYLAQVIPREGSRRSAWGSLIHTTGGFSPPIKVAENRVMVSTVSMKSHGRNDVGKGRM